MVNTVVAFPKIENAKSVRNLLVRGGYDVSAVCQSGAQALAAADRLGSGIIVCGYRFPDMVYDELYENVRPSFEMLLVASARIIEEGTADGVIKVAMPLKVHELIDSFEMIADSIARRKRKKRMMPAARSDADRKLIEDAKALLIARNHMTEEEAHRYLQKSSMDSGTNLVETAQMLLALMGM